MDFIGQNGAYWLCMPEFSKAVDCPAVFPGVVKTCKYLYNERHSRLTFLFLAELSAEPVALSHLPCSSAGIY